MTDNIWYIKNVISNIDFCKVLLMYKNIMIEISGLN